jgi:hypothetical protein
MSLTPQLQGIDELMEYFDKRAKYPYYCVFDKTQPISMYNGEDIEVAKEILKDDLERLKKRGYQNILVLSLFPEKQKAYKPSDAKYNSIAFTVDQILNQVPTGSNDYGQFMILQELRTMKSELEALKVAKLQEESEEEEEEENENMGLISGVNQLLEHPVISGLISKWLNGSQPVRNLAGVNDEEELQNCINILFSKGVTVGHLKKLADMPEPKIKMLLQML